MTDTQDKRSSAVNISMPWRGMLPQPSGSLTAADRHHVAFMYRGGAADGGGEGSRIGMMLTMHRWMGR